MAANDLSGRIIADRLGISNAYLLQIFQGYTPALHMRQRLIDEIGFPPKVIAYTGSASDRNSRKGAVEAAA
jgi:transcriptional regulator with XRE-family HTH domain